jgi:D-alanine-D-alanine ligase-like ATP-grasp enzyme
MIRRDEMKKTRVALVYNTYTDGVVESVADSGGVRYLRQMIRGMARALRRGGNDVHVISLADDLQRFQRTLQRLKPDVVFNQYDDVVHGALYEMRVAALVRIMGYPITGSPALALGLSRYKYMCASLLQGAGIPIPPDTTLFERIGEVDGPKWSFPLIVQPSQEHAGIGVSRDSIVRTKTELRAKVGEMLTKYHQPALAQRFIPGREFNIGLVGGKKLRVLPPAEVDYSRLPKRVPPIMSYAAKWIETSVEYQRISVTCPADLEPGLAARISSTASKAFRAIGGWGYGRVDIRLDEDLVPRVLEVNCNPCLDNGMGLARSARVAGIAYPELLKIIIRAAFEGPPNDVHIPMTFAAEPRAARRR